MGAFSVVDYKFYKIIKEFPYAFMGINEYGHNTEVVKHDFRAPVHFLILLDGLF